MRAIAVAVLALLSSAPAWAAEPVKLWEAGGFAMPESVLWDADKKVLYVSNINGGPADKDGNGYISKLSVDGKLITEKWAIGLDGPKGMALAKGRLYVTDIDRLVVIDTATGKITKTYAAPEARFLNDIALDGDGGVYVSDMMGNALWRLKGTKFQKWLSDAQLENPNGLRIESGRLVMAAWGPMTGQGFATSRPGALKAVTLADGMIRDLTGPIGNLDGLEPDGKGGWLVSDWMKGGVFAIDRKGSVAKILPLPQGSADIGYVVEQKLLLVPMMMDGKVVAYRY
jgi:sugar lactone lactonase YvrE